MSNLYEMLGVDKSATENEIRQAIALHHSAKTIDKNIIEDAKKILLNKSKRRKYDDALSKGVTPKTRMRFVKRLFLWVFGIFFGVVFVTSALNKQSDYEARQQVSADKESQPQTQEVKTNWYYSSSKDEMRNEEINHAGILSNNKHDFNFPYNGGSRLSINLRHKENNNDIFFDVTKGQIPCLTGCTAKVKFDDKPIQNIQLVGTNDGTTTTVFISGGKSVLSFSRNLKSSKKVTIELLFFHEGERQFTFDTSGLDWKHF